MFELSELRVLSHVLGDCFGDPEVARDASPDSVWREVFRASSTHGRTVQKYRSAIDNDVRLASLAPMFATHADGEPTPNYGALWEQDEALEAALEAASPVAEHDVCGQLCDLLPQHLRGGGVWRLFAEDKDWRHLGRFYASAAVALTRHDAVAARQYDLIGIVYGVAGRLRHAAGLQLGRRLVSLWRNGGLPLGIGDPHPPVTDIHAAGLVGPWVRRTQLEDWLGNDDALPEVRAIRTARASSIGGVLVGMCQAIGGATAFGLPYPERLQDAVLDWVPTLFGPRRSFTLTLAQQRSIVAQPTLPPVLEGVIAQATTRTIRYAGHALPELVARAGVGLVEKKKKSNTHVVKGLSYGAVLWPMVEAIQRAGLVSWRSDVPEIRALVDVKPANRGHLIAGMTQLTVGLEALGVPAAVREATASIFGSLMAKKGRSYNKAVFDAEDLVHLTEALRGDPLLAGGLLPRIIRTLTNTREQGAVVDPSLTPYRPYPEGWSWRHAITLRRKRLAEATPQSPVD